MLARGLRRKAIAVAAAIAGAALLVAAPSPASADTLRPLRVALTCFQGGLPYGLSVNNGSGWYYPSATADAYVVGNTKYFSLLIPASATGLAVNTACDGLQNAMWEGYSYGINAGTSTLSVSGSCNTYPYTVTYGLTYWLTYCSLGGFSYS